MRQNLVTEAIEGKFNDMKVFNHAVQVLNKNRNEMGMVDMESSAVLDLPVITCYSSPSSGYDYAVLAAFNYGFDEVQAESDWSLLLISISSKDIRPNFMNYSSLREFHDSIEEDGKQGFQRDDECENKSLRFVINKIHNQKVSNDRLLEKRYRQEQEQNTVDDLFNDDSEELHL